MKGTKRYICAAAALLLLLFAACEMMGPGTGTESGPEGKAAVRIGIEAAGIQGRTVLPAVELGDVTAWELWGGKDAEIETLLENFSGTGATVYLETGTWDFTLKGYNNSNAVILRGVVTDRAITLEGPNDLSFTVTPVMEGSGSFKITINLPAGHGITGAKVFKDGVEIGSVTPVDNAVVFEDDYTAGDYYFSVRLYRGGDLYGVVSETVQVRGSLGSEKTYNLTRENLNLTYVIDYHLNGGGLGGGENPGYYRSVDAGLTLPIPNRTGYTFGGWYEASDLSGTAVTGIAQGSAGDKAFYAQWTAINYTAAYDKNAADASGTTVSSAHTYDEAKALTVNGFSRTGYTFAGWNTQAGGGGTSYTNGQSVENLSAVNGGTVILYAQWTVINYNITYHLNGGTDHTGNPASYTIADPTVTLEAPGRAGYIFAGWYEAADLSGPAVTGIAAGSVGAREFYAKWTAVSYTVAYDKNDTGASGTTVSSVHAYDVNQALTANGFSLTGFAFAGWNTEPDGSGDGYDDEESVVNLSAVNNDTITLYAQWTVITYTVAYDQNAVDAAGTTASSLHTYNVNQDLSPNGFSKAGFTFAGWNTQPGGGGAGYDDQESVVNLSLINNDTITLYAQWWPGVSLTISLWTTEDGSILYSNNDITLSKSKGPGLDIPEKFSASLQNPGSYSAIGWELNGAPLIHGGGSLDIEAKDYPNGTYTLGVVVTKNGISYSTDIRFKVID